MNELPVIIETAKPKLDQLASKYRVDKLYLFGSVARDTFSAESDIDLLVSFKDIPLLEYADNYFDFQEELELLFKRKVDLVVDKSIVNPYLADKINKTRMPLYG